MRHSDSDSGAKSGEDGELTDDSFSHSGVVAVRAGRVQPVCRAL